MCRRQYARVFYVMLMLVFVWSTPVFARPDQIILINKTNSQDVRQYNYAALNSSFASYKGDKASAGLFIDYFNKIKVGGGYKVHALHDDASKIFADMAATNASFALIKGKNADGSDTVKFNLVKYTSKTDARFPNPVTAAMPSIVTRVITNVDPALVPTTETIFTPDTPPVLGPPLTDVYVAGIVPIVGGTPAAPILTFNVNSADRYSTGTATITEDVSYNIKTSEYDINGTATTAENLMTTALQLMAFRGNGSTSISGENLIINSPVTLTITGSSSGTTVYTVHFAANPE